MSSYCNFYSAAELDGWLCRRRHIDTLLSPQNNSVFDKIVLVLWCLEHFQALDFMPNQNFASG